jgi:drug/metabolite transporter superfamily protein YnfA
MSSFLRRFAAVTLGLVALLVIGIYLTFQFEIPPPTLYRLVAGCAGVGVVTALLWNRYEDRIPTSAVLYGLEGLIRACLVYMMVFYGGAKLLEGQFADPPLLEAEKPFYALDPIWKAWAFFGHSPVYNAMLAGMQLLCATLFLFDRTRRLADCLFLPIMGNIVLVNYASGINMFFWSCVFLIMGGYLLLTDVDWLLASFWHRQVPEKAPPMAVSTRLQWSMKLVGAVFVLVILGQQGWIYQRFAPPEKTPLYGIWQVAQVTPGTLRAAAWTKVYFERGTQGHVRDAGAVYNLNVSVDATQGRIEMQFVDQPDRPSFDGRYRLDEAQGQLVLAGRQGSDSVQVVLERLR